MLSFHPPVWLAARQISTLSEQAADDAVLDTGGEPIPYAKMLARLAEALPRRALTTELAAGIVLSKSAFLRRVEAILSDRARIRRLTKLALAGTILATVLSIGLAIALPLGEKEAATQESAELAISPGQTAEVDRGIPEKTEGKFKATLPNGATIELVGVSYHPSEGQPWWKPDGSPMPSAPYEKLLTAGELTGEERWYEFAFSFKDFPKDGGGNTRCESIPKTRAEIGVPATGRGTVIPRINARLFSFPRSQDSVTLRYGVSAGEWTTAASAGPFGGTSHEYGSGTISFSRPHFAGDGVAITRRTGITITNTNSVMVDQAQRIVALDIHDQTHLPISLDVETVPNKQQTKAWFATPAHSEVKEFRFEVRPYEWVEFRNISLKPGHKTDAEVVVEPPKESEEQIPPTSGPPHGSAGKPPASEFGPVIERAVGDPQTAGMLMRSNLRELAEAFTRYASEHGGSWPPDLETLEKRGYLGEDKSLGSFNWHGHAPQYVRPRTEDPLEIVAYYWPPLEGYAQVLHRDGHAVGQALRKDGSLVDLRGKLIREAEETVPKPATSEQVLEVLRRGEKFYLSQVKSGKGTISLKVSHAYKKNQDLVHVSESSLVTSVFNASGIRLDKKDLPSSNSDSGNEAVQPTTHIASDWETLKSYYPDRRVLEVGPCTKPHQTIELRRALPHFYGTFFGSLSAGPELQVTGQEPELEVTGQKKIDGSLCYVVEARYSRVVKGKTVQSRTVAFVDPQRSYLTPLIEGYAKVEGQNEVLVFKREAQLKEYADGFWAPWASEQITYGALEQDNIEETKFVALKRSMKVVEYEFNIPVSAADLALKVPQGTTVFDLPSGNRFKIGSEADLPFASDFAELEQKLSR